MSSATTFYNFEPVDSARPYYSRTKERKGKKKLTRYQIETGNPYPLTNVQGKVTLVVNTASKCGFTPQFQGLETLYKSVKAKHPEDFTILGFPCNQFGSQDPGSNDDIQSFCQVNYGVSFPVLGKLDVNGEQAAPVYSWLKEEKPGIMGLRRIKWNFEKFLISADGKVVGRWASTTKPEALEGTILQEIEKGKQNGLLASAKAGEAGETKGEQAKLS